MKIIGSLQNQDQMELTLSIKMTLKEWRELQAVIPEKYPHWKLGNAINCAVQKANVTIYETIEIE